MSLLFGRRPEARAISYGDVWSRGGDVSSLSATSINSALRLAPVYSSTRLLADQFAAAPLRAYRMAPDGSKSKMPRQPNLFVSPSPTVGLFAWKYQAITSCLLRGNTTGVITSLDANGWPSAITWLNPDEVTIDESGRAPEFYYQGRMLDPATVVHIPGYVVAGSIVGLSPLAAFKTVIETGLRAQDFGNDWFKNGAVPGGILRNTAQTINADSATVAKQRFKAASRGRDVFVTGSDWDFTAIGVPADEARFIETLKLTATQVANIYGVPPERVGGETGSSMTYGNREQDSLDLVTFGLRPWLVRFEESLTALMPRPQYAKFNIDAIVRADLETRMRAHEIALRNGIETNSEARDVEDRPPLTDAERTAWLTNYRPSPATQATRAVPNPEA